MCTNEEKDDIMMQIKDIFNIIKDKSGKKRAKDSSASVGVSK